MPIRFLSGRDFAIQEGCMILAENSGISVVLFKADNCYNSNATVPIFEELERAEKRVQFCIINVATARTLIANSNRTTTPIRSTPTIILYADGRPKAIYKGTRELQQILAFISTMVKKLGVSNVPFVKTSVIEPQPQIYKRAPHYKPDESMIKHYRVAGGTIDPSMLRQQQEEDASFTLPGEVPYNAPWQILD